MGDYRHSGNYIGILPESDGFRETATAVTQYIMPFDRIDGSFEICEPYRQRDEIRSIGDGRNVAKLVETGYENGEGSLDTFLQTGILLKYGLGTASTVGTAVSGTTTYAVTSSLDNVLTIDSVTWTTNAYADTVIEIESGDNAGERYYVISNTTDALTVYPTPPANITADVFSIKEAPYVHTISESEALDPFILHTHQQDVNGANTIIRDLIGCLVKSTSLKLEAGEGTPCKNTVEIIVPKSIEGSSVAAATPLTQDIYTWDQLDTTSSYITYNSNEIVGNTATTANMWKNIDSLEINVENDIDITKVMGDEYGAKRLTGKRDYSVKFHCFPQSDLLRTLRNTKVSSYATDIACRIKLLRTATDYIMYTFDKMYVSSYPNKLVDVDEKELGVDVELRLAPGGTCSLEISDALNGVLYYGG